MPFIFEVLVFGLTWLLGIYLADHVLPPLSVEWAMVWGMMWYVAASKVSAVTRAMFPPKAMPSTVTQQKDAEAS